MANKRHQYSPAQNVALVAQVSRVCPLCDEPLFYQKKGKSYKNYEIAHIYPLNPSSDEIELLKGEVRLSEDINHEDNVIPLCEVCHGKFDKPRTVEEYRKLVDIKKRLIQRSGQESLWKFYTIEDEISEIIDSLYDEDNFDDSCEILYSPKTVDEKLNETITRPTKRKIKNNVRDYYVFIKGKLALFDQNDPDLSEMISQQIKVFYLKQKRFGYDQQVIFENIVAWINSKTKPNSNDAAEILASFFIQNCEIFE